MANVFDGVCISDCIIILKLATGKGIYTIIFVYTQQSGRPNAEKHNFYDEFRPVVAEIPTSEILILLGDWNGGVGKSSAGFEGVLGGHGWGIRNTDGEKLLEFAVSCDLVIGNTCL